MASIAEYEAELRAAIDGYEVAREHYLRTELKEHRKIVGEWEAEIRVTATALVIARYVAKGLSVTDLDRIDHLLDSTVISRAARDSYRADAGHFDPPPDPPLNGHEWDDTDPYPYAHLVNWPIAWTQDGDDSDWLLDPLIAAHRGHAVYAKHGEGKSWTVLAAVAALATGRPFLNTPAGKPHHVLYLDYEMTLDDLLERMMGFHYGPSDDLSHLHYSLIPSLSPLDTAAGGDQILELSQHVAAELVVIDTTGRALAGDENDANSIQAFYEHTGQRLKAQGIALVRVDHAGKNLDAGQRGSSAKGDDVDIVWQVVRTDDGQKWTATKRRTTWVPPTVNITVTDNSDGTFDFSSDGASSYPAGTAELADQLVTLGVPLDWGRPRVRRQYGDQIKVGNDVLSAAIRYNRERVELGQIEVP